MFQIVRVALTFAAMQLPPDNELRKLVQSALTEDVGGGDVTSLATVPETISASSKMVARESLVVAGLRLAELAFSETSSQLTMKRKSADGVRVAKGEVLLEIEGSASAILTAERVALNFVQRLSGVATLTAQFVEAIKGTSAKILDTRKTTPGLRLLEKYAVSCGGGQNHRIGLFDMVLIKDNHLVALRDAKPSAIEAAVRRARERFPKLKVEVEADTLEQVGQAVEAAADIILLDNMSLDELRAAVKLVNGRAKLEASGGVNLQTVRGIAETGVDFISVGALTHSPRAVDVALDFEPER
ncbi:MAG: carboxylating nicotinate-nucleotide diphosphorylase [Verrucomicrobiota bacterium]